MRYNQTKGGDGEGEWETQADLQGYIWQTLIWGIILYIKHLWFLIMSRVSKGKMIPGEPGREQELHKILLIGFIRCIIRYSVWGGSEKNNYILSGNARKAFRDLSWATCALLGPTESHMGSLTISLLLLTSYQERSKATSFDTAAKVEGCGLQSSLATR